MFSPLNIDISCNGFEQELVIFRVFQVSPAPVRSPADAEKKRSLQRALDGLTPQLQEVVMEEGRQHDIRDSGWIASFGGLIYLCGPYVI